MKKLVILFVSTLLASTAAFAEVKIKGKNEQSAKIQGAVINMALMDGAKAKQNIASNKGNVTIQGDNKQSVDVQGAVINMALMGGTTAEQNIASNDGN